MGKLKMFVVCDQVSGDQMGRPVLNGIFTMANLPSFPATFSFSAVSMITEMDAQKSHVVEFRLVDENKKILFNQTMTSQIVSENDLQKINEHTGFVFGADFRNALLPKPGKYSVKMYLDGTEIGDWTFGAAIAPPGDLNV